MPAPEARSLHEAHGYRLTRIARLLRRDLLEVLAAGGAEPLTPEQFFLLFRLDEGGDGVPHHRLADPLMDDRPNITRQVSALARAGLVTRRTDPEDGRQVLVFLTEAGRQRIESMRPVLTATRRRIFGALPEADLQALERILDHLEDALQPPPARPEPAPPPPEAAERAPGGGEE